MCIGLLLEYQRTGGCHATFLLTAGPACVNVADCATARGQDFDEDDPVPYDRRESDYRETGLNLGTEFYPHDRARSYQVGRQYDNRPPVRSSRSCARETTALIGWQALSRTGDYAADQNHRYYDAYPRGRTPASGPETRIPSIVPMVVRRAD